MTDLKVQYVTTDSIQPHPDNPREGDIGAISQSIEHNGLYRPIIVHKPTGNILAGNHTYKALTALGHNRVPTIQIDCDETTATRIMLADNRTADLGTYNEQQLIDLLTSLDNLDGTGYDGDDLDNLLNAIPEGDAPTEELPQLWEIVIECENEQNQATLLTELTERGIKCRAVL